MPQEQLWFFRQHNLSPFLLSADQLIMLRDAAQEEIDARQEVRNKELKVELAKKVEEETGTDQKIDILELELRVARKKYAKRLSEFDNGKSFTAYQAGNEHRLQPLDGNYLKPLEESPTNGKPGKWISQHEFKRDEDGVIEDYSPATQVRMVKTEFTQPDGTPRWRVEEKVGEDEWKVLGIQ